VRFRNFRRAEKKGFALQISDSAFKKYQRTFWKGGFIRGWLWTLWRVQTLLGPWRPLGGRARTRVMMPDVALSLPLEPNIRKKVTKMVDFDQE